MVDRGRDDRGEKARSPFEELVDLIARLRDPESGCPWDRAQDHRSLRPYMLEEAYEAIAAIDVGDSDALADELGDVLLQVLLHSRIAEERGEFSIDNVLSRLAEKLTRRHPHVFGNASNDLASVHRRWEEIKARERQNAKPRAAPLPTLVRARKVLLLRAKLGKVHAMNEGRSDSAPEARAGARLLAVIDEIWREGFDPELVLQKALDRLEAEEAE